MMNSDKAVNIYTVYTVYFLELTILNKKVCVYLLAHYVVIMMFRNSLACKPTLCCENYDTFTEDKTITNVVCHDDMVIKLRFRHSQR